MMKLVVGVSGASGVILAERLLEELKKRGIETHLVVSEGARLIIEDELAGRELAGLADYVYEINDFYAPIASGSFATDGMVVIPCSMKTLAAIAHGISDNLLTRAADVCLKEGRKLVLVPRESPLSLVHLKNLVAAREAGADVVPPIPAFYPGPKSIADILDFAIGKLLDTLHIDNSLYKRWEGGRKAKTYLNRRHGNQ